MQKILSQMRRAIDEYSLIKEGDKIAVGVSGGKDSLALIKGLKLYSKFAPYKFEVIGITIDMFGNSDFSEIEKFCKDLDIKYYVYKSNIYETVFEIRKEKNPCSLCSKLRRGMLISKAKELGCNKLALGHTADDVLHTFLLSVFYEGRLSTFSPISYLDRTGMLVIRPLILTDEKLIINESKHLPVKKSNCPADKHTQREYVKQLLVKIEQDIPIAKDRLFSAITHPERYNLFDKFTNQINEINSLFSSDTDLKDDKK